MGTIHRIVNLGKSAAKKINAREDLSSIKIGAQDEMFHQNKPILTGIDVRSLYCYLMASENERDFDNWGSHLLALKDKGLNPDRIIGDDPSAIECAHRYVYPDVPYDLDHFHVIRDMMDMRRFFRNRLKSSVSERIKLQTKVEQNVLKVNNDNYHAELKQAQEKEESMKYLSTTIDTLVNWMNHDVLYMPGLEPNARHDLFDFLLDELNALATQHPHRIKAICTTLKNQKPQLLAFIEVLNDKFQKIADEHVYPLDKIWDMCYLQRCQHSSMNYAVRSLTLQDYFGGDFDAIEDDVLNALDSTERTSSMIENLHSRLSPYFSLRREIGFDYLELLRFYMNHTPRQRSARAHRHQKTPAQVLHGKEHPHWLDMLGFQRFKKAA